MRAFIILAFVCFAQSAKVPKFEPVATFSFPPRIIGGSNQNINSHPHQVSLQFTSGSHTCGASIISSTKLVCAAHCTQSSAGSYQIRAGSSSRTSGGQVRSVSRIVNHFGYCSSCSGIPNDISTIHLSSALSFGSGVASIPLASTSIGATSNCWITGWGRTGSSNVLPTTLQGVQINVITNSDCASRMSGVGGASILGSHICVFTSARGACNGDSGGPLRCGSQLHGVTSWVVQSGGNCLTSYPSVYGRVFSFISWINAN